MCMPDVYKQMSQSKPRPDPAEIPLGNGLADRARLVIQERRRRPVDAQFDTR